MTWLFSGSPLFRDFFFQPGDGERRRREGCGRNAAAGRAMKVSMRFADRFARLTGDIIGACIEVHRQLGPGLLESGYEECLAYELGCRGLRYERQPSLPLVYEGVRVEQAYQPDFIVNRRVIVEIKAVQQLLSVHKAQLRTYLKLHGTPVGLLVNFNVPALREDGIRRVTLSSPPPLLASRN
jgi:GxxExxY protein